jgi:hypothetical protein
MMRPLKNVLFDLAHRRDAEGAEIRFFVWFFEKGKTRPNFQPAFGRQEALELTRD